MTQPIDRAYVDIVPDTSNFTDQLDDEVTRALRRLEVTVNRVVNRIERKFRELGDELADSIDRGVAKAELSLQLLESTDIKITAEVDLDDAAARAELDALATEKITITAEVKVEIDVTKLQARLQAAMNRLAGRRAVVKIPVDIDLRDVLRQLRYIQRIVNQTFRLHIRVVIDERFLLGQLIILQNAIRNQDIDVNVNANTSNATRGLGRLQRLLALVAATLAGISVLIPDIASALLFATSGINAFASLAGLLVGIPAVITTVASVVGVLAIAINGMDDAIAAAAAGEIDALNNQLEKLAPSGREVALAVFRMSDEFKALRTSLQQRLFEDLADDLDTLAERILPSVFFGFENIATAINHALQATLSYLGTREATRDIGTIFFNISEAVKLLAGLMEPLTKSFVDLAAVGAPFLVAIADDLDSAADSFSEWIDSARRSGQLESFFQNALTTVSTLARSAADTAIAIRNIFSLGPSGQSFLDTVSGLADRFREFTESVEGQNTIQSFFSTLSAAANRSLGVIQILVRNVVGSLLPALNQLGTGLGPGVVSLIESLADGIDNLTPALQPVGAAISTVVDVLGPLIQALGSTLGNILPGVAALLTTIAEAARPFISAFARLATGLSEQLGPAISEVVKQLSPFLLQISEAVGPELDRLVDKILEIASITIDQITGENLSKIVEAVSDLTPVIIDSLSEFIDLMLAFLDQIGPQLPGLTRDFTTMAVALIRLATAFTGVLAGLQGSGAVIGTVLGSAAGLFVSFASTINAALGGVFSAILGLGEQISKLPEWVGAVVPTVISEIGQLVVTFNQVSADIIASILKWTFDSDNIITDFVIAIPKKIVGMVGEIISSLTGLNTETTGLWSNMFGSLTRTTQQGTDGIVGQFVNMPGETSNALNGMPSAISQPFNRGLSDAESQVNSAISTIIRAMRGLPPQIESAIRGVENINLFGAGKGIGDSLAEGLHASLPNVRDAGNALASEINDLLQGHSPTKKGPLSGRGWTLYSGQILGNAFAEGIASTVRAVNQAATQVATAAARPIASPVQTTFGTTIPTATTASAARAGLLPIGTNSVAGRSTVINNNMVINAPSDDPETVAQMILNRVAGKVRV